MTSNQSQIIEQAKHTYSFLGKAFKKNLKTIENQSKKQIKAIEEHGKQSAKSNTLVGKDNVPTIKGTIMQV